MMMMPSDSATSMGSEMVRDTSMQQLSQMSSFQSLDASEKHDSAGKKLKKVEAVQEYDDESDDDKSFMSGLGGQDQSQVRSMANFSSKQF